MTAKPIPEPSSLDHPYWEGAQRGKFVLQRCSGCGLISSQPRVVCPVCHGETFEWVPLSGRGTIHSYTIVRQSTVPGFREHTPYVVVHVEIEEQPQCYVTTNLLVDPAEFHRLDIGLPVVVDFERRGPAVIPQFRLADS